MTELLELAMQSASQLPDERQDHVARELLRLIEGEHTPEPTDPAHVEAIRRGLAQISRGEFATDEEIEAVYRSFDENPVFATGEARFGRDNRVSQTS